MLFKTRGIVLSSVKFKETSLIVKIFTEEFGLQTYIINGVRSSRGHSRIALYQPLVLLDMVVYKNEQKAIQRISECKCETMYQSIPMDMRKSAVAMFWAELLNKTTRDEGHQEKDKFDFIRTNLIDLDKAENGIENYPLIFGIGLCRFLGFEIEKGIELINEYGLGSRTTSKELGFFLESIIRRSQIPVTNHQLRRDAVSCLMNYYAQHFEGFGKMKSTTILKQLFS